MADPRTEQAQELIDKAHRVLLGEGSATLRIRKGDYSIELDLLEEAAPNEARDLADRIWRAADEVDHAAADDLPAIERKPQPEGAPKDASEPQAKSEPRGRSEDPTIVMRGYQPGQWGAPKRPSEPSESGAPEREGEPPERGEPTSRGVRLTSTRSVLSLTRVVVHELRNKRAFEICDAPEGGWEVWRK